jgi:hypothetical protein
VKVRRSVGLVSAQLGRQALTVALSATLMFAATAVPAQAITRTEVLKRARSWIKKHVMYSQSSYYQGYRRDCSGFVSMAWELKSSYTSSSIRSRAHRISVNSLRPGDAVRRSGHVELFDGWKNKRKRQYWALEESTWGKPALRRVKKFKHGYMALRLKGIKDSIVRRPLPAPVVPAPPSSPLPPSSDTTPSVSATPSAG